MKSLTSQNTTLLTLGLFTLIALPLPSPATEPCGDFGECKTLIEINASDGDIGFHFLIDGDDLNAVRLDSPHGEKLFEDIAKGPLFKQKLTETFVESSEPLCWLAPDADPDEEIVTLEEFLGRWSAGVYSVSGKADEGEKLSGESTLSHILPAAPINLAFSDEGVISWNAGHDLGKCGDSITLADLVTTGILPIHPQDVEVSQWEVVLEPEDGSGLRFSVRVPATQLSITVPSDYLESLQEDTLAKIEVGAITADDNATFTELGDICLNEEEGCEEEE